jgi:hypothetical protein
MGAGQLTNSTRTNNALNLDVMEGKILRLNTQQDGDGGADDWVPNDNPFYNSLSITARDYVYSRGHRNPQGLTWGNLNGVIRLYSTEQSDKADDELNVIVSGGNYGWDNISGFCDDDVNSTKIGGNTSPDESADCSGTVQPVFTTFHNNTNFPSSYPPTGNTAGNTWATIASSSVAFYWQNTIPGWRGSVFITPLKDNRVYRLKFNSTGTAITGDTISYFRGDGNRIRKITVDPNGIQFYVARDAGTIMEYTYTGSMTLPLTLISFNGALEGNNTSLQWETTNEVNTLYFDIERSTDAINFTKVSTVNARGENNGASNYIFKDEGAANQPANILYYRLKMVDNDQRFKYSNIVAISLGGISGKIMLTPNPTSSLTVLSIKVSGNSAAKWNIVDNSGRVVMQSNIQLKAGVNTATLDISKLAAGIYFVNVKGANINERLKLQKF